MVGLLSLGGGSDHAKIRFFVASLVTLVDWMGSGTACSRKHRFLHGKLCSCSLYRLYTYWIDNDTVKTVFLWSTRYLVLYDGLLHVCGGVGHGEGEGVVPRRRARLRSLPKSGSSVGKPNLKQQKVNM